MNNNKFTKQQTIPNLIVIDKEWVNAGFESVNIIVANYEDNNLLKDSEYYKYKGMQFAYKSVLNNSYPLSPIVEGAWEKANASYAFNIKLEGNCNITTLTINTDAIKENKQSYLSQPIKL